MATNKVERELLNDEPGFTFPLKRTRKSKPRNEPMNLATKETKRETRGYNIVACGWAGVPIPPSHAHSQPQKLKCAFSHSTTRA